ncbi:unannotated protein [freshwater metagenome]|uniref:Unannotated protein n=1 Tax=freshwater metagenome TaxID=449393 RepID=A0A6J6J7X5_9ZZZZ
MLFCNPDVKNAIGEYLRHCGESCWAQHCRRDSHDCVVLPREFDQFFREYRRPRLSAAAILLTGHGVKCANRVELVGFVEPGRLIASTLLGDDVNDYRTAVILCLFQRALDISHVVTIHRPDVFDVEV